MKSFNIEIVFRCTTFCELNKALLDLFEVSIERILIYEFNDLFALS